MPKTVIFSQKIPRGNFTENAIFEKKCNALFFNPRRKIFFFANPRRRAPARIGSKKSRFRKSRKSQILKILKIRLFFDSSSSTTGGRGRVEKSRIFKIFKISTFSTFSKSRFFGAVPRAARAGADWRKKKSCGADFFCKRVFFGIEKNVQPSGKNSIFLMFLRNRKNAMYKSEKSS